MQRGLTLSVLSAVLLALPGTAVASPAYEPNNGILLPASRRISLNWRPRDD